MALYETQQKSPFLSGFSVKTGFPSNRLRNDKKVVIPEVVFGDPNRCLVLEIDRMDFRLTDFGNDGIVDPASLPRKSRVLSAEFR